MARVNSFGERLSSLGEAMQSGYYSSFEEILDYLLTPTTVDMVTQANVRQLLKV